MSVLRTIGPLVFLSLDSSVIILKQLFNLHKTKNQNIALFVKISVLVWASSNPMGQVQNTLRLPLGQVTVSVLFLTLTSFSFLQLHCRYPTKYLTVGIYTHLHSDELKGIDMLVYKPCLSG